MAVGVASDAFIRLSQLSRYYTTGPTTVKALDRVSLGIDRGEFVAIMGQSGSGKSTLMNILGCLDQPTSGGYYLGGHSVADLDVNELSALRLKTFGFVFQRYQLLANFSALDNVAMPAIYSGTPKRERMAKAQALLARLGLAERADHYPAELSGGQQQRVAIARALINGAEVILADEPTGALDSQSGEEVLRLLRELNREDGVTVILITHDRAIAEHADRVIQMLDGHVSADSAEVTRAPEAGASKATPTPIASYPRVGLLESAGLALQALRANVFRTLLTLLGIIIGVAAVVVMMAIGEGGKQDVLKRIEAIGTNLLSVYPGGRNIRSSGTIATLSMDDARALESIPGVAAVAPERGDRATLRFGAQDYGGRVRGVTPAYFSVRDWHLAQGVLLGEDDLESFASVIVIGNTVAEELFVNGEDPVGQYVLMRNTPFQVIGVLQPKGASPGGGDMDDEVYVPITTAQLKFFGSAYLSNITIKVTDTDRVAGVEAEVTRVLTERHNQEDFRVRNTASLVDAVSQTQDTLTWLLGSVAAISLFVGGIGVMNIMLVNVSERRREIGLRIATGAKPQDILTQFNIEALVVCVLGGIIGVGVGLLATLVVSQFKLPVAYSLNPPMLAFGTSLLVGLVFGYAPAHKAASLNPVLALAED